VIKVLLAVTGFLFLLVVVGPFAIQLINDLLQAGQTVKDAVNP
jgi:hypothetical protein